ncbi:hypothetical protein [Octadecabacter arcticus]|uniref:hypothetical protein n=1 Tax=Octadecabacter arcticus TaxID=53946 RepID=UPI0005C6BAE5|nr:hypothetical protein [Octadecabacter arcticus]
MSRQKDHNARRSTGGGEVLRTVLPHNLAASLKHLPEHDIMRLTEALAVEMGSRGLTAAKEKNQPPRKNAPDPVLSQLTGSQISLIRSSIQAGVKPAALSRQFGMTRAQITAALKAGK